ncbi:MAG: DUF1887 family protein [Clostridia bacterium]|nr:DUF1887 family protein [Clostridia bacterium]
MEQDKRIPLSKGQTITLSLEADGSAPQKYVIESVAGRGGSTICYNAIRVRDGATGKLKEFYPYEATPDHTEWYYSLERCEDGQLIPKGGTIRTFSEMCEEYLNTYRLLNKVMAENPDNQVIRNYVQNGEILYGRADTVISRKYPLESNGGKRRYHSTVYIWSSGPVGMGFDEYLAEVRKDPVHDADDKLHKILNTVCTLADSLCAIHTAGLLHLDIKPDNFLIPFDSMNGLNTNSVSLFDISTLYHASSRIPCGIGTEGYRAPEVLRGNADDRSDTYAVGAMLFYALVITETIPDGLYRDSLYPDIDRLVRYSSLIQHTNASARLISRIAKIMKKCLAPSPAQRYQESSDLLHALKTAELEARQNAVDPKLLGQNKKIAIVDLNEKGINSPEIVIQKMLYDHPLYEVLTPGKTQIRVLVIGSGTYGQKFIDQCLQAGQMKGYSLSVTAVSPTPAEDKESYLQFRPALSRFVNVDGSMEDDKRAYAELRFVSINEACGYTDAVERCFVGGKEKEKNKRIVGDLIYSTVDKEKLFDYIFIALGNSTLNREIAKLCHEETDTWGVRCPVCYISERTPKKGRRNQNSMLYPVYISEPITPATIDPVLEQMAFNTDIAWNSALNMDVKEAFEKFRSDEYRYRASLAYVLSIPYKLFSIGIVLQNRIKPFMPEDFPGFMLAGDVSRAAEMFTEDVIAKKDVDTDAKSKFDMLVCLEHQRWVLNMVCESWDAPLDANGNLDLGRCVSESAVKNKTSQTHPCIVFSTENTPLSSSLYVENRRQKWDEDPIDPNLDALDKMSLELHRRFREAAAIFKGKNPLQGEDVLALAALISSADESVIRSYKQFVFCLKNILNGVESYSRQFDYYKECMEAELKKVPEAIRKDACDRLKLIEKAFFPVIEANLYRNYKATDEVLVQKIPFILTYRFQNTLVLAFEDGKYQNGRNEAVFANVAAATVLCPENILYLYRFTEDTRYDLLTNKLTAVLNYLGKRKVHCKVSLAVAFPAHFSDKQHSSLEKCLKKIQKQNPEDANASFADYRILGYENPEELTAGLLQLMKEQNASLYDGSTTLFDSVLDNGLFVNRLLKAGMPYFEFDWRNKKFTKHIKCDYLRYIQDQSSIRIHDMFALMNAEDTRFNFPEFADDYETLWEIYTGVATGVKFENSVWNWNQLCQILEKYESDRAPIAIIPLDSKSSLPPVKMEYVLPEYTYRTVKTILGKLIHLEVIDKDSKVSGYTSENCKVEIVADGRYASAFNALFARPENLLSFYCVDVIRSTKNNKDSIRFVYSSTKVENLDLDPDNRDKKKHYYPILQELERKHFIRHLTCSKDRPSVVSFEYASQRIKKLLTCAGEILEVYTYYQLLRTGYFDDVACGYEFRWQDGEVRNELDIVAVKGFRSVIVECKAVHKLELDYYHKLHSIAEHFGIGTKKVLVGNTYSNHDAVLEASNQMQRTRGNQLGIITVHGEENIKNIGRELMNIIKQ